MQDKSSLSLDWSQWLCPGPRRVFSADELARAGQQPWPRSVETYVLSNVVILLAINANSMPRNLLWLLCGAALAGAWAALQVGRWLWSRPTRLRLNLATLAVFGALMLVALALRFQLFSVDKDAIKMPMLLLLTGLVATLTAWWFLTIFRVQQIEARLRELDEQARSVKLAQRLATAQIQPHFLFNTLASLQHWVDTQDPRAGSTLRAFTQYLRATLPMFERESVSLGEELQIVRNYLEIMQARLGARLRWELLADPVPEGLQLPPGVLLTLVENALAHGIEPALRGGCVALRVQEDGERWVLEVSDDGAGLCGENGSDSKSGDGIGLSNTRARLQQQFGARATLSLSALAPGCLARIEILKKEQHAP